MVPELTIRTATEDDVERISQFVSGLAQTHIRPTLAPGGIEVLLDGMSAAANRARIEQGFYYVLAEFAEALVGLAALKPPSHLYYLFVATEHQGHGIGRFLFQHLRQRVKRKWGSPAMTVNASLNAIEIYHRLGFRPVGDIRAIDGVRFQPMQIGTEETAADD